MSRCTRCNFDVPEDSVFCTSCGNPMVAPKVSTTVAEAPAFSPAPSASAAAAARPALLGAGMPTTAAEVPIAAVPALGAGVPTTAARGPAAAGAPLAAAAGPVPAGTIIDGKYRIIRVLGEGGMGVVYLARSLHTDTDVVLKAVRPEIAHRADIRNRTLAEGRALARIDHPNVVQLKSVVADDKELWLVMQYIEGGDLEERIIQHREHGQLMSLSDALGLFRQVLAGVAAAHAEGVIHRDIKPANILIRAKDGVVKVTDFGIAKPEAEASAGRGDTQGIIGSVDYMAPEQVRGERELDRRVDIYALGVVFYEMLTGRLPFEADNTYEVMRLQVEGQFPNPTALRPDLPPEIDAIVQQACAKDRQQRFDNCETFTAALSGLEHHPASQRAAQATAAAAWPTRGVGTVTGQAAEVPATQRESQGRGGLIGAAAVVGMLLVGGALVATGVIPIGAGGSGGEEDPNGQPSATLPTATATTQPSASAAPKPSALEALVGIWNTENGRQLKAVRFGDTVEFQVVDAKSFAAQGYRAAEARFVLREIKGKDTEFKVEDRVRPVPPTRYPYGSANARATCLGVWTEAQGKPLQAVLRGERLDVDFAKIEPTKKNFVLKGRSVASCRGLEKLEATRLPISLRR